MSESSDDAEFTGGEDGDDSPRQRKAKRDMTYADDDDDNDDNDDGEGNDTGVDDDECGDDKAGGDDGAGEDDNYNDDDSDDDIPLSQLAGKKQKPSPNGASKNGQKKSEAPPPKKKAKSAAAKKPPSNSSTNNTSSSNKKYDYPSAALYQTECVKGLLIQRLLCRWWYAYDWPAHVRDVPPPDYDALDGFPGVFVGTSGDNVGHILDTRDDTTRPCFRNFARKSSSALKDLLLKAIDTQLSVLEKKHHAHDTESTQKELKDMRKWANRIDPQKADTEAAKVLKASGLRLDS